MIIVSACLAGVACRYNGQAFPIPEVIEMVKKGQALPVCPEILGKLPTPRTCAERLGDRIITQTGQDVTSEFEAGAKLAADIAQLVGCRTAILKAKSPSCGKGLIYNGTFSRRLISGDGIFCALLQAKNIQVITENEIKQAGLGDKL
ncbi:MAG: DUF523 domain-containing protein [Pelosinus sp.]|nr:DUF523 domain-containing protein [Pelosinus sp.]